MTARYNRLVWSRSCVSDEGGRRQKARSLPAHPSTPLWNHASLLIHSATPPKRNANDAHVVPFFSFQVFLGLDTNKPWEYWSGLGVAFPARPAHDSSLLWVCLRARWLRFATHECDETIATLVFEVMENGEVHLATAYDNLPPTPDRRRDRI